MSFRGGAYGKRKRPGSEAKALTPKEQEVLEVIRRHGNMGIWKGSIIREVPSMEVRRESDNCVKTLLTKGLIKEVADVNSRGKKRLMGVEFQPSNELTGGVWYQDGVFDVDMIENLRKACKGIISRYKVQTADGILQVIKKSGGLQFELKIEHVKQVLDTLCLENTIFKVRSNGVGEFVSFPMNSECYKIRPKQKMMGALASIPCGACPRINQCSPDGVISPATCVYFTKWLEF